MGLKWIGEWKCSFSKGLKAEAFLSAGYDFSDPEGKLKHMVAQERCLKAWDREVEPGESVQSKFLVTSPVHCLLDFTTDVILQTGPVSSPFSPRIVSAFLSILQLPNPTAFQESFRHKSKGSAYTKQGTHRRGVGLEGGKGRVNGQPIAICFSSCFFYIKMTSTIFFFFLLCFFSFKEKEFSAI